MSNWITLYPQWYIAERSALARRYPDFRVDERLLRHGVLLYYGDLIVRTSGGAVRHPVSLMFPNGSPYDLPVVTPVEKNPDFDADGCVDPKGHPQPKFFDRRHQMPGGGLCLFQHETRGTEGGATISAVDVLLRAERWFLGHHTGRWPPDSHESELEPHFTYVGDVLLSNRFYAPEVKGHGRFFMVRDMERVLVERDTVIPPLIVTVITFGEVEVVLDARADLEKIFPWLTNDVWNPDKLIELEERQNSEDAFGIYSEHGFWWELPKEPSPFHDGAGLLRELSVVAPDGDAWQMVSQAMGADLATRSGHFVGLRYPGRDGRHEWLILLIATSEKERTPGGALVLDTNEKKRREEFERADVGCYRANSVRQEELNLRNSTVVSAGLADKTVALIGLGALGGRVAELLAQAGVGSFRLCDNDVLKTGNVVRHIGGLSDFGSRKTRVVATRLLDINPKLAITAIKRDSAISSLPKLQAFIGPADVVVCTIADENVESAINQIAILQRCTVIYGRAMRRGTVGRVFVVRPGVDACKTCLGQYALDERQGTTNSPKWVDVTERSEDILLHECGRPVIPASAIDLSFVSSFVARKALDVLESKSDLENHLLWSRGPATDIHPSFDKSFATIEMDFKPRADCPACQEPDVTTVVITPEIREIIQKEVEASTTAETGGILIGYIENRKAIVVRATGPGPKAKRTPYIFERDVEFVQQELDRAAQEFGKHGLYIGEWHSHLVALPEPSGQDVQSLCGIAQAPNYATRCPAMIIAGLDKETGKLEALKCWTFPVSGRVYDGQLEVR